MPSQVPLHASALDVETRSDVRRHTETIKGLMRRSAQDIMDIGHHLIAVKALLEHGDFVAWLQAEFAWTPRTAQRFMRVATTFTSDNVSLVNIAPSALYLLASPSTPETARDEALERARQGERVTHRVAQQVVTTHRSTTTTTTAPPSPDDDGRDKSLSRADATQPTQRPAATNGEHLSNDAPAHRPNAALFTSTSSEWYTPPHIIARVRQVLGTIDLDPASSEAANAIVGATRFFTVDHDGLTEPWGGRVFLNPPYGRGNDGAGPWVAKLVQSKREGSVTAAVALLPARTETTWFAPLFAYPLCFIRGRLTFSDAAQSATFPSVVAYLGDDMAQFHDAFSEIGVVMGRL